MSGDFSYTTVPLKTVDYYKKKLVELSKLPIPHKEKVCEICEAERSKMRNELHNLIKEATEYENRIQS